MKDMVFLALKTGLRFGELIAIEWPDFDFDNKRLTINKSIVLGKLGPTKNGKVRYIPLTDSVCEYFRGKKKGSGLAFHDGHGGIMRQKRCSYYLERTYRKAGLNPLGWQCLTTYLRLSSGLQGSLDISHQGFARTLRHQDNHAIRASRANDYQRGNEALGISLGTSWAPSVLPSFTLSGFRGGIIESYCVK